MIRTLSQILQNGTTPQIRGALEAALKNSNESPFWSAKIMPLIDALLSVLVPLRDQNLLFDPEGKGLLALDGAALLRWCDLYSLRTLAFTLQRSNAKGTLIGTKIDPKHPYTPIDLSTLGSYLSGYMVNLENDMVDFPIAHYNVHIGLGDIIANLLKEPTCPQ